MRILHLDSGSAMRGGQWQALRLHIGLLAAGHDSLLLAPENSPLLVAAKAHYAPCGVLKPLRLPAITRRFDIVHAHDARSHTWAALFSIVPLVVARRVAFPVRDSAFSRWKYRRPDLFIAVSRYVAQQLQNAGVEERRITVVHDGVQLPERPSAGGAVLIPATNDAMKATDLALEAARIAGIEARLSHDLAADLPSARALVYLTRSEGLGSGILLGMAHGVTVIASNVGGIPELITDGVNGILVSNDPREIAAALRRIGNGLGCAARETVMRSFTDEHMVGNTIEAYRRVAVAG